MNEETWVVVLMVLAGAGLAAVEIYRRYHKTTSTETILAKVDSMATQVNELTLRVVELELARSGYRLWTAQLRGQIVELGYIPVPPPPWLAVVGMTGFTPSEPEPAESLLVQVYRKVAHYFNREEIADLALQTGIDPEAFGGETRDSRARELVEHAARHGKLPELVKVARGLRQGVLWPVVPADIGAD